MITVVPEVTFAEHLASMVACGWFTAVIATYIGSMVVAVLATSRAHPGDDAGTITVGAVGLTWVWIVGQTIRCALTAVGHTPYGHIWPAVTVEGAAWMALVLVLIPAVLLLGGIMCFRNRIVA